MKFQWLKQAMLCVVFLWALPAGSEVVVYVTKAGADATPIAIVPFGWQGAKPPLKISAVVSADLARTGRFKTMPESDMLQTPTIGAEIDFSDWRILDTETVVVGQIRPAANNQFSISFWIYDVFRGEQLLGYQMTAPASNLRRAAHEISDLIYEKLTGVRGIAATRIAYINVQGTIHNRKYQLYVADSDGENSLMLLEAKDPIMSPAWSPDGRKLAYVSFESKRSEIWIQELRTGARQRASARLGINSAPAWSPDGRKLAMALSKADGNLDIYIQDVATKMLTRLTFWSSIETEPNWSADGRSLYFTSDRSGGPQIYKLSLDGGTPQRVSFEGNYNARPRISPDGSKIAVVHNDRGRYRIAVVDVEREHTQIVSKGTLDESPSFAPNGETIIYATRDGQCESTDPDPVCDDQGWLSTISIDGRFPQRVGAVRGEIREPAWSPFLTR